MCVIETVVERSFTVSHILAFILSITHFTVSLAYFPKSPFLTFLNQKAEFNYNVVPLRFLIIVSTNFHTFVAVITSVSID